MSESVSTIDATSCDPALLSLIAESMAYAYALFDDKDRLVVYNSGYLKHSGVSKKFLAGRPAYEDILYKMISRGRMPDAQKNPKAWVKWRLKAHQNPTAPIEVIYKTGRVLLINEQRHENGYTSCRYEDVTEARLQQRLSRERAERARTIENQLEAAIESMSDGFAIFDPAGKLILCNTTYRESNAKVAHKYLSGQSYKSILTACARESFGGGQKKERDSWIKWRMSRQKNPGPPTEYKYPDGKWIRYSDFRSADGNHVVVLSDITDRKKHELAVLESEAHLEAARHQLSEAIDSMSDSLVMYDADDRFVICNSNFRKTHKKFPDTYRAGITISETVRILAEGAFFGEVNNIDAFVRDRIAVMKSPGTREIMYPGGRYEHVRISKTRDGGTVMLWTDITKLKKITGDLAQREEHLRGIMETVLEAIITIDARGIIDTFNPAAEQIFGYDAQQVIGKNIKKLMPQPYRREHDGYLSKYQQTGVPRIIGIGREVTGRRKDGSTFPMELSVNEGLHAGQKIYIGAVHDITERKAAEEALKLSEKRFALAMKASNEGIWDWDIETGTVHLSRRIEQMLGLGKISRVSNKSIYDTIHPEDRDIYKAAITAHLKGETASFECEFRRVDKNGEILWLRDRAIALRHANGRAYRMIGSLGDITKRKRDEEALRDALRQAEIANRTKTDFLANISHELRTPLNAIIGFSDLITSEIFGPIGVDKYREYTKTISESGHHLLDIINDILDISRVEVGKLDFRPERVELAPVFEACLRLIRERAAKGGLTLRRNIQGNLPDIQADPRRLKQILLNLLSNAVKFTPRGGTVTLKARITKAGTLVISVRDSGIGMKAADIPKVLIPFAQVDSKLSRCYEGTGLGLPLTKSFIELHGGEMGIKSAPGKGTTVTVYLPIGVQAHRSVMT